MNPANLPFDSEAMLHGLRVWVECESPTYDAAAVDPHDRHRRARLAIMGASIERIAGRQGFGGCVRARFPHPKAGDPESWSHGPSRYRASRRHADRRPAVAARGQQCWGPGIYDMKGGNYLALEAIRQLARAAFTTPLPITVLFTSDEEVGTPVHARPHRGGSARATNTCWCRSRPRQTAASSPAATPSRASISKPPAGRATPAPVSADGRSAIREMARKLIEIEDMTTEDCTFSVGIDPWRAMGELRRHHLHRRGASMAKRQERSRSRRRAMLALSGRPTT